MLRVWQKRLLDNKTEGLIEYQAGTTGTETLQPGIYEMVLIGSGGRSIYKSGLGSGTNKTIAMAQGGIGGTLIVRLNIATATTIDIHVGRHSDADTYITGISGVTLRAGGGTDGSTPSNTSATAGKQGTNIATGSFLYIEDNKEKITSTTTILRNIAIDAIVDYSVLNRSNTNYPENPSYGSTSLSASNGYLLIKKYRG